RTLIDLGLDIDYFYAGSGLLEVQNGATLTIEPGVTIQFTHTSNGGGMEIKDGATIVAVGTAEKHIQFIGRETTAKGSWDRIEINTTTDNRLEYCDFINGGKRTDDAPGVVYVSAGKLSISHSKISGSKCNGLKVFTGDLTAFNHNVIENCDLYPISLGALKLVAPLDETSDLTNNTLPYVFLSDFALPQNCDLTINKTSVPYYVNSYTGELYSKLTINAGITFYMAESAGLRADYATGSGRLIINGTATEPVTFTRLPGTTTYWANMYFAYNRSHELHNVILEYCGNKAEHYALGFQGETTVTLDNVTIRNSLGYGVFVPIYHDKVSINHNNSTVFENCQSGNVRWHDNAIYSQIP
ncbi:MAG: hypothetical protein LBR36_01290, partial [Bacteroidales bacterium]|nr:hypothetical protein [Bacteroidales bacterium]